MVRARTGFVGIAVAWLACAGCRPGADPAAPPCSAVAVRFLQLAEYDLSRARLDDTTARGVADQLPAMRDSLTQACTEGRWSAQVRTCLVHAADHLGFETCEQQLTDEQRRDLSRPDHATSGSSP
jgi:hypothetical protein